MRVVVLLSLLLACRTGLLELTEVTDAGGGADLADGCRGFGEKLCAAAGCLSVSCPTCDGFVFEGCYRTNPTSVMCPPYDPSKCQ